MMSDWKDINIGSICSSVCSGGTPSSRIAKYYGGDIPWLNTKEINFNRIYSTEKTISEDGLNNSSAKWIKENSVTVAMYGATAGKTAITKIPLTTNQACCNLTIDDNKADYDFIYYALCNKYVELSSLANGGAQQNLNSQIIKDFIISVPSLEIQKKIGYILKSLDDKIEVNRKINENLEQQAQALFKSWFVDFEPFKDGKFVESDLGMIPEGWKVGKLNDYVEVKDGTHDSPKPCSEGHPLITSKFINPYSVDRANANKISDKDFVKINERSLVEFGDILMSMIGTVGLISYVCDNEIDYAIKNVALFKTSNVALFRYYLLKYLKTKNIKDYIDIHLAGSTQKYISLTELRNIPLIVPTDEVLSKYNKLISPIIEGIIEKEREISSLSALRDTLLPRLMSGEINLSD